MNRLLAKNVDVPFILVTVLFPRVIVIVLGPTVAVVTLIPSVMVTSIGDVKIGSPAYENKSIVTSCCRTDRVCSRV